MSVSVVDRPESSRGNSRVEDSARFKAFAFAIVALDLILLFLAATVSTDWRLASPLELLAWTLLVALAGLVPLRLGIGPSLAMDLPLLLAAAFVFNPLSAGLVALLGALDIREVKREISLIRSAWNRAQTSLSVMTASVLFGAMGGLGHWPITPLIALGALAADAVVNYLIVGYGTSLRSGQSFRRTIGAMRIGSPRPFLLSYGCFGFMGILIAEAHAAFGLMGVIASFAPIVLGRQAFLHRSKLDGAERRLAATAHALRHVDERIAAERRDERTRIAEALHDEVLQDLYNVTIRAQVLRQDLISGRLLDLEDDLPPVIKASEAAVEDLREVIQGLRSAAIGHAGLVETLGLFARHLETEVGAKVVVSLDPSVRSSAERELVIYQVAREALTNSVRHANARTIWLSLEGSGDSSEVTIEDDGCGFDSADQPNRLHFGLQLMNERAKSIGATLNINSRPGSGTVVRMTFRP